MKQAGIYGLSRGDLLEGMMTVQNPLDFIPLNESADEISRGRVVSWITSWFKENIEAAWGGRPLNKLAPDDWFELHIQDMHMLCTPTPVEMENVVELFN